MKPETIQSVITQLEKKMANESVLVEAFILKDLEEILNAQPESEYTKQLEQKLIDIECGDCGKNMLECRCDN